MFIVCNRIKMDMEGQEESRDSAVRNREIVTTPAKKRKVTKDERMQQAKRRKGNNLMMSYITCKRWQENKLSHST